MKLEEQISSASTGFERFSRPTKRAAFLEAMDAIVPWHWLCALIKPHYSKGDLGRPPIPLDLILRIYFLKHRFDLADGVRVSDLRGLMSNQQLSTEPNQLHYCFCDWFPITKSRYRVIRGSMRSDS